MRKFLGLLITGLLMSVALPVLPANAAVVKTTISISTPSFVFAGVANPVDVSLCPKSSLYTSECIWNSSYQRSVTLWANGKKLQTLTTTGGGGVATFFWTPKSAGSSTLKVTVAARSGYRALTSEIKKLVVRPKTKATTLGTIACGTVCVQGLPNKLDFNIEEVITAGIVSGVVKNRTIRFQSLSWSNEYFATASGTSSWQPEMGKYGYALSLSRINSYSNCTPGETRRWNFRFYVDATYSSPAGATKAKWIDLVCPRATDPEPQAEIEMTVEYQDQNIDYSYDYPAKMYISIYDPDDTSEYGVWTQYCDKADDCSVFGNWHDIEGDSSAYGSSEFSFYVDPGEFGDYWVRAYAMNWSNVYQATLYSDWYSVYLG